MECWRQDSATLELNTLPSFLPQYINPFGVVTGRCWMCQPMSWNGMDYGFEPFIILMPLTGPLCSLD